MSLCTIIIPTLENCKVATDFLVEQVQKKSNSVNEIIFINNRINDSFSERYKNYSKVKVIHDMPNLMVNPAWNYGMTLVKTKYYALLNDDLFFHGQIIDQIIEVLENNDSLNLSTVKTMVDYDLDRIHKNLNKNKFSKEVIYEIRKYPEEIKQGWFMIARTNTYQNIPSKFGPVMTGDDYLYIKNQEKYSGACLYTNNTIYHLESSTVYFFRREKENWGKISKPFCPEKIATYYQ